MKKYNSTCPEISIKMKHGEVKKTKIRQSSDIYNFMKEVFDADTLEYNESAIAVYLNRANNTIGWFKVSQGGIAGTVIDNKMILGPALKIGASAIIIAHNHPSGNLQPSNSDRLITKKLKNACDIMEITLIDHLIITTENYYSFADEGEI